MNFTFHPPYLQYMQPGHFIQPPQAVKVLPPQAVNVPQQVDENLIRRSYLTGSKPDHEGKMARKKKKKSKTLDSEILNDSSNESTTSESTSDENTSESTSGKDEDSSQEESSNQTIKRKPDSISPPDNQLQPKIVNCTTTPKSVTEKTTSSNDNDDSPSLTTTSSDTSRDSHGLLIDESDPNASPQDDAALPIISDEDEQTKTPVKGNQTKIPDDEQTKKRVPYSYSLNLPTVK